MMQRLAEQRQSNAVSIGVQGSIPESAYPTAMPAALALGCIEPSGCATGEPGCTSRGNEGMSISLSMVQMGAWVSIERVVSPPEGSVRQIWTTRSSNLPWGSVSQTLPTQPLREVLRQLPIKWRMHHVNMSRDKFVRQTQAQSVCICDT